MKIVKVIWLEQFSDKVEVKHRLTCEEVEEIFANDPRYKLMEKGRIRGEDLYRAFGKTNAGRLLLVFFIYKSEGRALVISARDASGRERKRYDKKKQ